MSLSSVLLKLRWKRNRVVAVPKADERPDILIADTEPLLYLAQADALPLLHQIGRRVILPDMLAFEATRDLTKSGAARVCNWIAAGQAAGSNAPVTVEGTDTGHFVARRSG